MAAIAKLTVANAKSVDATNWIAVRDATGPQEVPDASPRGDCIVKADTGPLNNPAEWAQIVWSGGDPVPNQPNQRSVTRQKPGSTPVTATIGASAQKIVLWVMWAEVVIRASGARPALATPWSKGTPTPGPDKCGAFDVPSWTMGTNARGQIVAIASLLPAGVGKVIANSGKAASFNLRRELTAHDYVDGAANKHAKSFHPWIDDTFQGMQSVANVGGDEVYDTDGPDLPTSVNTAETYNNFRQWLEWDGQPCSGHAAWHWQARWKDQNVTMKDVGTGAIVLPNKAHYPKPP